MEQPGKEDRRKDFMALPEDHRVADHLLESCTALTEVVQTDGEAYPEPKTRHEREFGQSGSTLPQRLQVAEDTDGVSADRFSGTFRPK